MSSAVKKPDVYVGSYFFPTLAAVVRSSLPGVNVIEFKVVNKTTIDEADVPGMKENAEILFIDSTLARDLSGYKKLKWVQVKGAGADPVLKNIEEKKKPKFRLTRTNINGTLVGEYVISFILALERKMFTLYDFQQQRIWASVLTQQIRPRLVSDLAICIIGVGDVGKEVAKRCKLLRMTVYGVTRSDSKLGSEFVDKYYTVDHLNEVITMCDYICCCLPSTPKTRNLLSGDVLKICSNKKPVLISCGRGDVINESTIIKAIQEEWISAAVLDVVENEPLPKTSPLWDIPNVYITPHIAGYSTEESNVQDYVNVFVENYERYCEGRQLLNEVDFDLGY